MSENNAVKDQKIIIDLNETDTKGFDDTNFIQLEARDKLFILINKFLNQIPLTEKNVVKNFERVHHTILIQGKRGSGKTSFILSVKKQIENGVKNPNADAPTPDNLIILDIIDPTLIESKEHVFINIITRIKDRVEKVIKDKNDLVYKNWKSSLKELAGGLSMLDSVGGEHLKESIWDSPELILEKGLNNAKHGYKLEENFQTFVHQSLQVLNQKAFVLILDDIDTSLNEGRLILETIRKYLTTPQLITILLGDIELYATLVRQLQWEKIDPIQTLRNYELSKNRDIYLAQIEHLEEQYLTKILMPEYRIDLQSLHTLKSQIQIQDKSLSVFLDTFIQNNFLEKGKEAQLYAVLLLSQPLRSILQMLKFNQKDSTLSTKIKHTFISTIQKQLKRYDMLDDITQVNYLNKLSSFILNEKLTRDSHLKLLPEFKDIEKNISMLYLNSLAFSILKPSGYLSYFIKVGYALEQYSQIKSKDKQDITKFIDHIALDSSEPSARISKRLLTTFEFVNTKDNTISNISTNTHANNPIFFGNLSFPEVVRNEISNGKNLSLFMSTVYNPKAGKQYFFLSFFNLIGTLSDLAEIGVNDDSEKLIKIYLEKNNLIRDYFTYGNDLTKFDKNDEFEGEEKGKKYNLEEKLIIDLTIWAQKSKDVQNLPLSVLAKIWIRIVYTFINIEQKSDNRSKNIFELLELYFSGFLNAIFVQIELYKGNEVDLSNPNLTSRVFYDKLNKYQKTDNYTLFDFMYECPIFSQDGFKKYFDNLNINQNIAVDMSVSAYIREKRLPLPKTDNEKIAIIKQIPNWEEMSKSDTLKFLKRTYHVTAINAVYAKAHMGNK